MWTWNPWKTIGREGGRRHVGLAALATCRGLIDLLMRLQQHRGMSSAWLAGDRSFEGRMQQRRGDIESLIPQLREGFEREAEEYCPCFTGNDLRLFRFRWQELLAQLPESSVHDNIENHNRLIGQLLDWLAAAGESRIELAGEGAVRPGLVRNFAVRLPELAECLGKARALGSSVAAQGACSPVARVRLIFLVGRAEALLRQAAEVEAGVPAAMSAKQKVQAMEAMVRSEILLGAGVQVDSEHYFNVASQAIDAVFAWIGHAGETLEAALGKPGHRTAAVLGSAGAVTA